MTSQDDTSTATGGYSPAVLGRWIAGWPRLLALAEGVGSGSVIVGLSGAGGGGGEGGRHWAEVVADIESAWIRLPAGSLERRVIAGEMGGQTLSGIAVICRTRKATILAAHHHALAIMARTLRGATS